jgi:hypothetical protein
MHESEAMEFIDMVFGWFVVTKYESDTVSDEECELCLEKIRSFIRDNEGYWVKEKTLHVIDDLLDFESNHDELPSHLGDAIDAILKKVEREIFEYVKSWRDKNFIKIPFPFPSFIGPRNISGETLQ